MIVSQMATFESKRRSPSVVSISSQDDGPPRKRTASATPQPETPRKKLARSIDDMALVDDGDSQPKKDESENSQLDRQRDKSLPALDIYKVISAHILRMLHADTLGGAPKDEPISGQSLIFDTVPPPSKHHLEGKGYMSVSDDIPLGEYFNNTIPPKIDNPNIDMATPGIQASQDELIPTSSPEAEFENLKPFKCEKCGSRWKSEISLRYHLTKSLTSCNPNWDFTPRKPRGRPRIYDPLNLECDKCGTRWKAEAGLRYHLTKSRTACNPNYDSRQARFLEGSGLSETSESPTPSLPEFKSNTLEDMSPYVGQNQYSTSNSDPVSPLIQNKNTSPYGGQNQYPLLNSDPVSPPIQNETAPSLPSVPQQAEQKST